MKSFGATFALLALVSSPVAFAGNTSCQANYKLSCSSIYSIEHHEKIGGPSGVSSIQDIQPEPFDPSECEASVVLYTVAGKFVATYSENQGTVRAWIDDTEGKETSLLAEAPLTASQPVSTSTVSYAPGDVDSVIFNCSLVR